MTDETVEKAAEVGEAPASQQDVDKLRSVKDSEIAQYKQAVEAERQQRAAIEAQLAEAQNRLEVLQSALAKLAPEAKQQLQQTVDKAEEETKQLQLQLQAARIVKAREIASRPGSKVTMDEILSAPGLRTIWDMENWALQENAKRWQQSLQAATPSVTQSPSQPQPAANPAIPIVPPKGMSETANTPTTRQDAGRGRGKGMQRASVQYLLDTFNAQRKQTKSSV